MNNYLKITAVNKYYRNLFNSNHIFDGHRHDDYEINFIIRGELEIIYENIVLTLKEGDFFLGEPNAFHRNRVIKPHTVDFAVIHCSAEFFPITGTPHMQTLIGDDLALMNIILSEISSLSAQNGCIAEKHSFNYTVVRLLEVLLYRIISRKTDLTMSASKNAYIYNQAVNYMQDNLNRSLHISDIARSCGVCPTILKNTFSELAGCGIGSYYLNMKIQAAKNMIANGLRMIEISEALGFSSQAYFSQCFKRECGCSPLEFKKRISK